MCTARASGTFYQLPNTTSAIIFHPTMLLVLGTSQTLATGQCRENSSKHPCTLASFSRARMPRSVCTRDVTCELYCISVALLQLGSEDGSQRVLLS